MSSFIHFSVEQGLCGRQEINGSGRILENIQEETNLRRVDKLPPLNILTCKHVKEVLSKEGLKESLKEILKPTKSNLPDSPEKEIVSIKTSSQLSDDEMFLVMKEAKEQRQVHKKKKEKKTASEEQHEKFLHAEVSVRKN